MKQSTRIFSVLSMALCILLIAASALCISSCRNTPDKPEESAGEKTFTLLVETGEETKTHTVTTEKATVGEALVEAGIVEDDRDTYGLYIKTVDGITADYNKDGTYWMLYEGDVQTSTGADQVTIKDGATYSLKREGL